MIPSRVYKIYQINNSFEFSMKELLKVIETEFQIKNIIDDKVLLLPDDIKTGNFMVFTKPEYVYIKLFLMPNGVQLVSGYGFKFIEYQLNDNKKLYVYWNTSNDTKKNAIDFNNSLRKNKLNKLNII